MSSGFGAARCWMRGCLVDVLTHQSRFMRLLCTTVHKHTHTHTKPDAARTIWCKILTLSTHTTRAFPHRLVQYSFRCDTTGRGIKTTPAHVLRLIHMIFSHVLQNNPTNAAQRSEAVPKRGAGFQQHDCNVQEKGRSLSQSMRSQMFTGRRVRIPHRSCKTFASLNHPSTHW